MRKVVLIMLLVSLIWIGVGQSSRRGSRRGSSQGQSGNIFDSIANMLFPGPTDTPIITRIFNKISFYLTAIVGSVIAYFTFFRKNKQRNEKINQFLADWKEQMVLGAYPTNKQHADKLIYELNFKSDRRLELKSHNGLISFNITLEIKELVEDSPNLYALSMEGNDPEGKSTIEGFASFKEQKVEMALALTHHKYQKKEQSPVYYFQGKQGESEQVVEGQWWIEGQKGTAGEYCGKWKFQL